jgi:hypothetical protein
MPTQPPVRHEIGHEPPPRNAAAEAAATASVDAHRARLIAIGAIGLAIVAIGLAAWHFVSPSTGSCQSTAWEAAPSSADLPADWSIGSAQYAVDQVTTTLLGPTPQDQTSAQAVVYATVTCYAQDAAKAVTLAEAAATEAGEQVTPRDDLGDQAYGVVSSSGASYVEFRHGDVVADVAASGDTTAAELEAIVAAVDRALGGDGPSAMIATPEPSGDASPIATGEPTDDAASSPSDGPIAPELEAALPASVNGTTLTKQSDVASSLLGDDAGSRAIIAALRAEGISPDDLQIAQAYDDSGDLDLSVVGFRIPGVKTSVLQSIVLDTWLAADGPGVTTSSVKLGDRNFTKIDFGDGGALDYLSAEGDTAILIETSDAALAAQAAAALP